jgi:hypothetical protein
MPVKTPKPGSKNVKPKSTAKANGHRKKVFNLVIDTSTNN